MSTRKMREKPETKFRMLAECICKECGKEFLEFTDKAIQCPECGSLKFKKIVEYPKDRLP